MIQWDSERKVLVDYMGMPLSRTEAEELRKCITLHLKHSAADLAGVALKVTKERFPNMVEQINFDPDKYT